MTYALHSCHVYIICLSGRRAYVALQAALSRHLDKETSEPFMKLLVEDEEKTGDYLRQSLSEVGANATPLLFLNARDNVEDPPHRFNSWVQSANFS